MSQGSQQERQLKRRWWRRSGNGHYIKKTALTLLKHQVPFVYPVGYLDADVLPHIRFTDGDVIEFDRCHGLVYVLVRAVDVDTIAFYQVFVTDDCGDTNPREIMGYPSNHGLHVLSLPTHDYYPGKKIKLALVKKSDQGTSGLPGRDCIREKKYSGFRVEKSWYQASSESSFITPSFRNT